VIPALHNAATSSSYVAAYSGGTVMRGAGELVPLVPEILPGVQYTIELFVAKMIRKLALRFADDIDPSRFVAASRDRYPSVSHMSGVSNGWSNLEKNGINDPWERHLL
jgi:hypothetical protein